MALRLLEDSDTNTAGVAFSLLCMGLSANVSLYRQVMAALLKHIKTVGLFHAREASHVCNTESLLQLAIRHFINNSYNTICAQAGADALQKSTNQTSKSAAITDPGGVDKLSLGDSLEIWVGSEWVVGTIVRSNVVTGEFQIEHSKPGASRLGATEAMALSVVARTSRTLRAITPHKESTPPYQGDFQQESNSAAESTSEAGKVLPSAVPEYSEEDLPAVLNRLVSLVFGSVDAPVPSISYAGSPLKHLSEDTPTCENHHRCKVMPVAASSAGFMCGVCAKLYAAGLDMSPPPGSDLPRFPQSRLGQAMYKWSCEMCQYDVCLTCFPNVEYPAGGSQNYFDRNAALGTDQARYVVDLSNLPHKSKFGCSGASAEGVTGGPGVRCTVCLMGRNPQTYCKVRAEASSTSAEIARVSHGSVVDVLDVPDSLFFQLFNGAGYVKKQPGRLCYWKRLARDRYTLHSEEDVGYFSDNPLEMTPLMASLGALGNSSQGTCEDSKPVEEAEDPASLVVDLLQLLVNYDTLKKDTGANANGGASNELTAVAVQILKSANALFELVSFVLYFDIVSRLSVYLKHVQFLC